MEREEKKKVKFQTVYKYLSAFFSRFNIVVTQRAKKDMAKAEKAGMKKLNQRTKLEHAKAHRKAFEQRSKRK